MRVKSSIEINRNKEEIWQFMTDYTKWVDNIKAITKVEVIEQPETSFLGFKWKETRKMFGKESSETMWVTDISINEFYKTRAESHGSIYLSTITIAEKEGYCILTQEFEGISQSFLGKIMMDLMGGIMKKSTEKSLYEDLIDVKKYIENK